MGYAMLVLEMDLLPLSLSHQIFEIKPVQSWVGLLAVISNSSAALFEDY